MTIEDIFPCACSLLARPASSAPGSARTDRCRHRVLGLTRSDAGAEWLKQAGAEAHRDTLEEPDSLASGARQADAVIHTAFDHDFSRFVESCEKDRQVIEAMGAALAGSDKPLIITSGTGMGSSMPGTGAMTIHDQQFRARFPPLNDSVDIAESRQSSRWRLVPVTLS